VLLIAVEVAMKTNEYPSGGEVSAAWTDTVVAAPGPIFNDERLAKPISQPLGYDPNYCVSRTSRWKTNKDPNRSARVGLCPRDARDGRQGGSAHRQMQ